MIVNQKVQKNELDVNDLQKGRGLILSQVSSLKSKIS